MKCNNSCYRFSLRLCVIRFFRCNFSAYVNVLLCSLGACRDLMETIKLDGRKFTSKEVLHKILKEQLDFPDYYGENADALWDFLTGWIDTPVTIEWEFFEESKKMLGSYAD